MSLRPFCRSPLLPLFSSSFHLSFAHPAAHFEIDHSYSWQKQASCWGRMPRSVDCKHRIDGYCAPVMEQQKKMYRTFHFDNTVVWNSAFSGTLSTAGHAPVAIGNPPVFKGTPDVWCPEDLLVGALNACLMLTFVHRMQLRKLQVAAYESNARGILEHKDGQYRVTAITVQPHITVKNEEDLALAADVMKEAADLCMISNSILAKVQLEPEIHTLGAST